MKAVVPAAGEGTRLGGLTADRPKGLVKIAGKPLLTHVFEALQQCSLEEIVVIIGHRGAQITDHYGTSFRGTPLRYVTQDEQLGLAHALLQAEPFVETDFVSLNGDNVLCADLEALKTRHEESGASATCFVERVTRERAGIGGVFELADDRIVGLVEKPPEPPSRLVPRGCWMFSTHIFDACRRVTPAHTGEYELSAAVDLLLAAGRQVEPVSLDGWCVNVNTPDDCAAVSKLCGE